MQDLSRTLKFRMHFSAKVLTVILWTVLIGFCACDEFEFSSIFPQTGKRFSRDAPSGPQSHPVLSKLESITSALDRKLDLIGKFDEAIANILLSFDAKIEKIHDQLVTDERNINELTLSINARLVQLDSKIDEIDNKIKNVLIDCDKQGPLHLVLSEHKADSDVEDVAQLIRESLDGLGEKIQSNIMGDGEKLEYLKRYLQVVFEQDKNLNNSRSPESRLQNQRIERKTTGNTDLINEILGMVKNRLRSQNDVERDDAKKTVDAPGSMTDIVDSFENRRSQIDTQKNKTAASRKDMLIFPNVRNKPAKLNNTFISDNANVNKEARGFSCVELMNAGMRQSGVYYLQIRGTTYWFLKVYCEQEIADGGWTVIQRRGDFGKFQENFNRDWADYKNGFGDPAKEFWMGNENIYMLTNNEDYALRIELEDFEGNKRYAQYNKFKLHSEADYYKLEIDGYEGTAGDSLNDLTYGANNSPFSTYNRDNDRSSLNCASMLKGGWWWRSCGRGLNGLYLRDPYDVNSKQGIIWFKWKGWEYTLKTATMMVKPLTKSMTSPPTPT